LFEAATRADPLDGAAFCNLGVAWLRAGDFSRAAAALDRAVKLRPADPAPRLYLGVAHEEAGRLEEAAGWYAAALDLAPGDAEAVQALARARVRLGLVDDRTVALLRRVTAEGASDEWRAWAKGLFERYAPGGVASQPFMR
jgi:cytochrome c-type biogenesis protein CcmH/NrfG